LLRNDERPHAVGLGEGYCIVRRRGVDHDNLEQTELLTAQHLKQRAKRRPRIVRGYQNADHLVRE
jgi:hypothetical protein